MDRGKILETFYEVVNESVDWYAEDKNNNTYTSFIDGVLGMTNKLLENVEINRSSTIVYDTKTITNDANVVTVAQANKKHVKIVDGDSLSMQGEENEFG